MYALYVLKLHSNCAFVNVVACLLQSTSSTIDNLLATSNAVSFEEAKNVSIY